MGATGRAMWKKWRFATFSHPRAASPSRRVDPYALAALARQGRLPGLAQQSVAISYSSRRAPESTS